MDLQGRLVLQGREVLWELQEPEERQAWWDCQVPLYVHYIHKHNKS